MESQKLNAKDLINVGVFTAMYFVVFFACGMLGYIPIFMLLLPLLCPLAAGIPFMLYLTKVTKFGMVTLTGTLCGLFMLLTGHSPLPVLTGFVCGLAADRILKSGRYQSASKTVLAYGVYSLWLMGMMVPLYVMSDSYRSRLVAGYGEEYAKTVAALTPAWTFPVLMAVAFVGGILGARLGRSVLKKHFVRAGIA